MKIPIYLVFKFDSLNKYKFKKKIYLVVTFDIILQLSLNAFFLQFQKHLP